MPPSKLLDIPTGAVGKVRILYDFVTEAEERFLLDKIAAAGGDSPADEASAGGTTAAGSAGQGAASSSSSGGGGAAGTKAGKAWGWKELNGRRSMYWGGTLLPSSGSLVPAPFPSFMDGQWPDVLGLIAETGVYDEWTGGSGKGKERGPNHCLVNEYLPSQGILPHTDGPAYLPCTTTLSLGSHTVLCLRSKPAHLTPFSSSAPNPSPSTTATTSTDADDNDQPPSSAAPSTDEIQKIDLFLPPRSLLVLTGDLYSNWLHGIQPLPSDSSEVLKGCANWEGWWKWQAIRAAASPAAGDEVAGEGGVEESGVKAVDTNEEVEKRRKLVEAGHGWERGKRVSLTCRRVAKVRKGLFKLG
ncbi:hypothetical protein JCM11251_007664 [Rhodosporidiobolus azoricus]